jgi:hypothetical protein
MRAPAANVRPSGSYEDGKVLPLLKAAVPALLPTIGGSLSKIFRTVNVRSKCSFTLNRVEKSK